MSFFSRDLASADTEQKLKLYDVMDTICRVSSNEAVVTQKWTNSLQNMIDTLQKGTTRVLLAGERFDVPTPTSWEDMLALK